VFRKLEVLTVLADDDYAALRWTAIVKGTPLHGLDLLTLNDNEVKFVEVFLRPARELDLVRRKMVAAWPRTP
jgi:hypothetical protein